ncbi:MAG: hypothetical protein U9M92_01375 [Patescibacteria group bacterium]|nr:hypothetical protein [Patescibacteria group bacterium]
MLYVFYGADTDKAREKWRRTLAVFKTKNETGDVFHFDPYKFNQAQLEELAGSGTGLFDEKRLVASDRLLENKEALIWFEDWLEHIAASTNTFVLLEEKIDAKLAKKIEKAGGKLGHSKPELGHRVSNPQRRSVSKFEVANPFALTNAFGDRDRKKTWVKLQKALYGGETPEQIFWRLSWQIKTMLLVKKSAGAKLKSLKPFVLQKTSRQVAKFEVEELEQFSNKMIALWHDSRRGLSDFGLGLEQLVLSL